MFKDLPPADQLDKILSFIVYYEFPEVQDKDIMLSFDVHMAYLYEILDRLALDGFIEKANHNKFSITFNGRIFFNNGGYAEQKRVDDLTNKAIETTEKLRARNEKYVSRGSVYVAIGTIGLLIWEIGRFIFPAVQYYCHCEFVWQK